MADVRKGYASAVAYVRGELGYEVVDAYQGLAIEITAVDITLGDRKDPWNCAVALATRREDGADMVCVIRSTAILVYHRDKRAVRYQLNGGEQKVIREYDQTGKIEPQKFWLAPVWPTNRFEAAGRRRHYQKSEPGEAKKQIGPVHVFDGVRNWHSPRVGA